MPLNPICHLDAQVLLDKHQVLMHFQVASDATCYAVGVFIEKEKTSSEDVAEISYSMKSVGYKWIEVPAISKAMCAIFPFKENFLAILVAVSKVYPAMRKYIQVCNFQSNYLYILHLHVSQRS